MTQDNLETFVLRATKKVLYVKSNIKPLSRPSSTKEQNTS